ncbi:MAG: FAD-dependent oxidoreductase [Lysobacterales bacterium]
MSVLDSTQPWDVIIVGAGNCGMAAAVFAAKRSQRVLLLDAATEVGGTLLVGYGQISAAGTRLQAEKGIEDSAQRHFDEAVRISGGTIDPVLAKLAIFNAGETFDWMMDRGYEVLPECPSIESAHEPYDVARYYWGANRGLDILRVLDNALTEHRELNRVEVATQTRVIGLLQDRNGVVNGVEAEGIGNKEYRIEARNVVLAMGGYGANPTMFRRLNGQRLYINGAYEFAQGDGINLGVAAGGFLRGREKYLSNFGWLVDDGPFPANIIGRANTYPESRMPWEIYVNSHGKRFIREDQPSVDVREHALLKQPDLRYWVIFDQKIFEQAPPIVFGKSREEMAMAFNTKQAFRRAESLTQLAQDIGLDPATLNATVTNYNQRRKLGDDEFAREHMPLPILKPPFYAIRQQGGSVTSTVGLAVNDRLQVIKPDGSPIPGLFAGGEILGSGQLQGNAFVGGMMAMPAIVFGRLLGEQFLDL